MKGTVTISLTDYEIMKGQANDYKKNNYQWQKVAKNLVKVIEDIEKEIVAYREVNGTEDLEEILDLTTKLWMVTMDRRC